MTMRIRALALIALLCTAPVVTGDAVAARRLRWPACRAVCADFIELCHDICQTSFGRGLRALCRRECKKRALRACRANQGEFCGDYS